MQFMSMLKRRKQRQFVMFTIFRGAALINVGALVFVCGFLLWRGLPAISWEFISAAPRDSMTAGGIFPAIMGTIYLCVGALLVALPLGIASAVYLSEYAKPGRLTSFIRLGINNLAGVPSVVFGLFGLAFFVVFLGWGVSILSGACTLGVLTLPLIIGTSEEAFRNVPKTYREASLGLGATKWATIWKVLLPSALPGVLTGSILGLSRAAGETAAIMFTAAVFFRPGLPGSPLDSVMALPYHIYVLATAGTDIDKTQPLQYGTALVLIVLVLIMNLAAIYLRGRIWRKWYNR